VTDLDYYAELLRGSSRIDAFGAAIRAVVRPGDRVLDLGTGLGTYAFLAARAGAAKVWAVERDPIAHVAETLAATNGLAGRVEVLRGDAETMALPDAVDVLVFEDFPTSLLDERTHALLRHVQKVLVPDGTMIPRAAHLCVAPVQSEDLHRQIFPIPADGTDEGWLDLDWRALRPLLANHPRRRSLPPAALLAPPLRSGRLALRPPPGPEELRVAGAWDATTPGTVHALALWFELEISDRVHLSNEPRDRPEPWGQTILPLDPPLRVAGPSRIEAAVWRERRPGGAPGWLAWEVRCGEESRRGHEFGGLTLGIEEVTGGHIAAKAGYGAHR
jgi:protein arginine N-methyltransferase 7